MRTSARNALKSATAISNIAEDLLALKYDVSRLAPFAGYCMYTAASIQVALLASNNVLVAAAAQKSLSCCLAVLKSLKVHWANLEGLVSTSFC